MADNDLRDDGTVVCAIHGMRYDPALADGCIKCPRAPNNATGRRSAVPPRSSAPKANTAPPSVRAPQIGFGSDYPQRPMTPAVPFEPAYLGSTPYQQGSTPYQSQQGAGPTISIIPGPQMRRTSRRGLMQFLGLVVLGGAGAAAWTIMPEATTDWEKKITTFRYGPAANSVGSLFVPSAATERACPLLVILDNAKNATKLLTRYAKHCEEHGWIAATTDAFGRSASADDNAAAALFLEQVRANANVEGGRAAIMGFGDAADAACRLGILEPKLFSAAVLQCCPNNSWHELGALVTRDVAFYLFTRAADGDREDMITMRDEMQRKGVPLTFEQIDGRHAAMERDEMDNAFAWLDTHQG